METITLKRSEIEKFQKILENSPYYIDFNILINSGEANVKPAPKVNFSNLVNAIKENK